VIAFYTVDILFYFRLKYRTFNYHTCMWPGMQWHFSWSVRLVTCVEKTTCFIKPFRSTRKLC